MERLRASRFSRRGLTTPQAGDCFTRPLALDGGAWGGCHCAAVPRMASSRRFGGPNPAAPRGTRIALFRSENA